MEYHKGWHEGMSLEDTKNLVYWERNMLALKMAQYSNRSHKEYIALVEKMGHKIEDKSSPCGWYKHDGEGFEGWSRVISLFDGRMTFHVPDDFDLGDLPEIWCNWDGHTTAEKWEYVMRTCGCQLPNGGETSENN